MTLSYYDPKLLNFIYELTKLKKLMSYKEIAKNIKLESGSISPKTVERWFKFLKQKYPVKGSRTNEKFSYFPSFFNEKLGLVVTIVICEEPKEDLKNFPLQYYQFYTAWLYDTKLNKGVRINTHLVPIKHLNKFKEKWKNLKNKKIIKNYKIYTAHKGFEFYSPWHKTIDKNGVFHPEKNDEKEIDKQIKEFEDYLHNLPSFRMIKEIKKNPFIIPVLFEYHYENYSSLDVWKRIKKSLGSNTWVYIKKKKKYTEGVGVKRIQQTIKDIYKFSLFHKMRLTYLPIELNNFFVYNVLKFKSTKDMLKKVKELVANSIQINIFPMENNQLFIVSLLNNKSLKNFFNVIENIDVKRILFLQHEKSLSLLTAKKYKRFGYNKLLNPQTFEWKD